MHSYLATPGQKPRETHRSLHEVNMADVHQKVTNNNSHSIMSEANSTHDSPKRRCKETKNKVRVILGAQWGDEGKGKLVDLLATEADVVCRCAVSMSLLNHVKLIRDDTSFLKTVFCEID